MHWILFGSVFVFFIIVQILTIYHFKRDWTYGYLYRFMLFVVLAVAFGIVVDAEGAPGDGLSWFSGYIIELTFSTENILLFHTVIEQYQVPPKNTMKALFHVMQIRVVLQLIMFLGLSRYVEQMLWVPFVLGALLVYMGVSMLLGHNEEHALPDYRDSIMTRLFRRVFGDRFLLHYDIRVSVVAYDEKGKWFVTLLGPVLLSLVVLDFFFEIDVTILKIENMDDHFIAFTSSALAAFAVPELYAIMRYLFEKYYLLKYALGLVIIFFGIDLLCERWLTISDLLSIVIVLGVIAGSIVLSWALGMGPGGKTENEEEHDAVLDLNEVLRTAARNPWHGEKSFNEGVFDRQVSASSFPPAS